MLREDGAALDDAYVYRFGAENFMVVFNAGNFERDYAWITAVNEVGRGDLHEGEGSTRSYHAQSGQL